METNKTKGQLSKPAAISLVVGNMIGSGIFLLPASLALYGSISLLGWVFSSLGALVLAKVFSGLSLHISKSGGPYTFSKEGFGDFVGFWVAWGYWISLCATNAAIIIAMLGYLTVFFPAIGESAVLSIIVGLSVLWLLTYSNTKGIQVAGKIQLVSTIIKLIPLISVALVGLFYMDWGHFTPFNLSDKSAPQAIMEAAALTFFAFLGIECATIPSENVKGGKSVVSKATMIGTIIAVAVYVLSSTAVMGLISPEELSSSRAPFADAAVKMWGEHAKYWVAFGAVVSTFGALNGWLLSQAQMPMAAARDRLFPKVFALTNSNGSPAMGFILSSCFITLIMVLNFSKGLVAAFQFVILLSTLTALVPYIFSSATHILMVLKNGKRWGWMIGLGGFSFSLWAIVGSGSEVISWGFILLLLGLPIYIFIKTRN